MSKPADVKSESMERSQSPSPPATTRTKRRETIFERKEIVEVLTPIAICAIQKELVELREEFEERVNEIERRTDRRIRELLQQASDERIDMEKLRIAAGERWETATGSTAQSRSSKGK